MFAVLTADLIAHFTQLLNPSRLLIIIPPSAPAALYTAESSYRGQIIDFVLLVLVEDHDWFPGFMLSFSDSSG